MRTERKDLPEAVVAYLMTRAQKDSWADIATAIYEEYKILGTSDRWRSLWRRISNRDRDQRTDGGKLVHNIESHGRKLPSEKDAKLLAMVKGSPRPASAVAQVMGVSERVLSAMVEDLKTQGYEINMENGSVWLDRKVSKQDAEIVEKWDGRRVIRFLALSDTHLCSKYQQLGYLNEAYDDAIARNCDFAIHCGDLTDGFYQNRPGHIYEIFKFGFDDQLQYVVDNYPKRMKPDGSLLVTKIISGNHDHTHQKADGANLVKAFARSRDDIEFLGDAFAKLWITPNCDIDMQHPLDGSAYALSYSMQKLIDALQGGEKPKIMFVGHHHKAMLMNYRNIHAFEVPSMQAQTPFLKGKRVMAVVGWWIVTVEVDEHGTVDRITPELCLRYEMRRDDY